MAVGLPSEAEAPKSEILRDGAPSGKFVSGAVLEAAIQWDTCYLIFLTDDVPFEDILNIHLLDAQLNLLDSVLIGAPYSSGSFSSLELCEPNTVRFRFIGDTTWSVELLPRPGFRIPYFSEPAGVKRPLGLTRHFIVRGDPKPQKG